VSLLLPGSYVAADSILHRLDPRVKMAAATVLMVLPFVAPRPQSAVLLTAFVVIIACLAAVPTLALLQTLRTVIWIGVFMSFFYAFTTPGPPLLTVSGVSVTWAGLAAAGQQIYRLCLLVIVASLLTYTTSPTQLAHGLEALLEPFARLGLPVRALAMVMTIALRFVPTLAQDIAKIEKAQRARGADPGGNPLRRLQSWVPMFVPIFVSAYRRADQLAVAMESRGFRGAERRTRFHQLHLMRQDLIASTIVLIVSLAIIALSHPWIRG
jgi:energy-coupling factor transport system permease protein